MMINLRDKGKVTEIVECYFLRQNTLDQICLEYGISRFQFNILMREYRILKGQDERWVGLGSKTEAYSENEDDYGTLGSKRMNGDYISKINVPQYVWDNKWEWIAGLYKQSKTETPVHQI